jgi:hypothetical protein
MSSEHLIKKWQPVLDHADLAEVKEQLPEEYLKIFGGAIEDFIESPSEL